VTASSDYVLLGWTTKELAGTFQSAMQWQPTATEDTPQAAKSPDQPPNCPKCGLRMIHRTAKRGKTPGQSFWGGENYPRCREMLANTSVKAIISQ